MKAEQKLARASSGRHWIQILDQQQRSHAAGISGIRMQ